MSAKTPPTLRLATREIAISDTPDDVPEIESAYIMASPEYSFLSSTGVKELATFGGDVSDLVPEEVAKALTERIER